MMEHSLSFSFKARYFTLGSILDPKEIWFVLHGYGQLASFFLRKFSTLEEHNILVVAPEALSRFYLQDTEQRMKTGSTRVGATWMTREDRLADIQNYLAFLNEVYAKVVLNVNARVTILGFSQGAATATRWVLDGKVNFSRLILWSGILPPDIDFSYGREILRDKQTYLVYGNQDPFLNDERFAEMKLLSEKLNITPNEIAFDGDHNIDTKTLLSLV
jgi:predicted esterase